MSLQATFGGNVIGKATASLDTAWYAVIPGRAGGYNRLVSFSLTAGNTANLLYAMRPIGRANCATNVAADAGATLVIDADPSPSGNTIAAGDQVIIVHTDGTYSRNQVNTAGWNGTTKTLTFTANVAKAVNTTTGKVFMMGVYTDTDPITGLAFPQFPSVLNTQRVYSFTASGFKGHNTGDPLLLYCPNATNVTVLDYAEYAFTRE